MNRDIYPLHQFPPSPYWISFTFKIDAIIKNYFKIAWRNLSKNKTFSLINIIGLASGLACFILIALYVADELNYDRYNKKAANMYRINSDIVFGGNNLHMAVTADPMGAALKNESALQSRITVF